YRNDGVDIKSDMDGFHVFNIEEGEWLQYTISSGKKSNYKVKFRLASLEGKGLLSMVVNGEEIKQNINLLTTTVEDDWKEFELKAVPLKKGKNIIRVKAIEGGFTFKDMKFVR